MAPSPPKSFSEKVYSFNERHMLIPKLLYLVLNLSVYSTHTYIAKFFEDKLHIECDKFGFIAALLGFNFLGSMLWSSLADRYGHTKHLLSMCTFMYALTFCGLLLDPFGDAKQSHPSAGTVVYLGAIYCLANLFSSGIFPLTDSQVMLMLVDNPRFNKEVFGKIRLYSSLGHGVITVINGFAIGKSDYKWMFINLTIFSFLSILLAQLAIPNDLDQKGKEKRKLEKMEEQKPGAVKSRPFVTLISNPNFIFFLLVVLIAGYSKSVMSFYLSPYLELKQKQEKWFVAIAAVIRTFSEIAVFFYGNTLTRIFGFHSLLLIGQLTGLMRVAVYSFIPTEGHWYLMSLPAEFLKGVNTACVVAGGVRLASDMAPDGSKAAAQGLFSGVYSGLSAVFAGIFSALLIMATKENNVASSGIVPMFRYTTLICSIAFIACFIKYGFIDRLLTVKKEEAGKQENVKQERSLSK